MEEKRKREKKTYMWFSREHAEDMKDTEQTNKWRDEVIYIMLENTSNGYRIKHIMV